MFVHATWFGLLNVDSLIIYNVGSFIFKHYRTNCWLGFLYELRDNFEKFPSLLSNNWDLVLSVDPKVNKWFLANTLIITQRQQSGLQNGTQCAILHIKLLDTCFHIAPWNCRKISRGNHVLLVDQNNIARRCSRESNCSFVAVDIALFSTLHF